MALDLHLEPKALIESAAAAVKPIDRSAQEAAQARKAAALVAVTIEPRVIGFCLAAHRSVEPGHRQMLSHLGLTPLLELCLRLGEGSGAALALPLIESATKIMREMATFASAGVSGPAGEEG